jgi:hypothetical protein
LSPLGGNLPEMARKKKTKKQPNLRSRIVSLIREKGPIKLGVMVRTLKAPYQSLNTEALELRRLGVLQKDEEGVWSLIPGVDPAAYGVESIDLDSNVTIGSQPRSYPTLEDEFRNLLRSVGVKSGLEPITSIFFSGDIWDPRRLHKILTHTAQGFVTEDQCKLIMAYWMITKGVPYRREDFFDD